MDDAAPPVAAPPVAAPPVAAPPVAADERLLLLANEAGEVPLISALMQDATVRLADIAWQPAARRLVLLGNRFRWEAGDCSRVRSALRIESVGRLQRRGWPAGDVVLDLLALTVDDGTLTLTFAASATLRAEVETIDIILEDIAGPWHAARVPHHA